MSIEKTRERLLSFESVETRILDHDVVERALSSLPAEQSHTVQLAYFRGYTQMEISTIMSVPLGTVKSRLRLALERLRTLLLESVV